ncbi:hypothetical protein BV898_00950 [Hypsibius exemplaris]|uniref:Uncharacterized protein n=1 Tax=Hypsibius exemplaris TaxID=2072580 RepID=A0A1W0XCP9_HYPEX|nr:hypothetical protein BV898_00950 [Hypsibius exemplaris]
MPLSGTALLFLSLAILQVFLPLFTAQLTFTPGWKHRILNKDISSRSEHGGKRAAYYNALRFGSIPGKRGEMDPQAGEGFYYRDEESDKMVCKWLEAQLNSPFFASVHPRMSHMKIQFEALWEQSCGDSSVRGHIDSKTA